MAKVNKNKGITMVALIITIIVLMILAGTSIYIGNTMLKTIKTEEVQTNLISIKSKAKGIAEEINAIVWTEQEDKKAGKRQENFLSKYHMEYQDPKNNEFKEVLSKVSSNSSIINKGNYECYKLTEETLKSLGLSGVVTNEGEENYYVIYDTDSLKTTETGNSIELDVIRVPGVSYESKLYYNLEKIQEVLNEDK